MTTSSTLIHSNSILSPPSPSQPNNHTDTPSLDPAFSAQIRSGLDIIHSAVDSKVITLLQDVNHWRSLALSRQNELQSYSTEIHRLKTTLMETEQRANALAAENSHLRASKHALSQKYATMKKIASQLEAWRRTIIQMVEYTPTSTSSSGVPRNSNNSSFTTPDTHDATIVSGVGDQSSINNNNITVPNNMTHLTSSVRTRPIPLNKPARSSRKSYPDSKPSSEDRDLARNEWQNVEQFNDNHNRNDCHTNEINDESDDDNNDAHRKRSFVAIGSDPDASLGVSASLVPSFGYGSQSMVSSVVMASSNVSTTSHPDLIPNSYPPSDRPTGEELHNTPQLHHTSSADQVTTYPKSSRNKSKRYSDAVVNSVHSSSTKADVSSSTVADAQALYRAIRSTLTPEEFTKFAQTINAFNSSAIGLDETVARVDSIVTDRSLASQMRNLIYRAVSESSFLQSESTNNHTSTTVTPSSNDNNKIKNAGAVGMTLSNNTSVGISV